jgi:lysophospholipase L1-like esterase
MAISFPAQSLWLFQGDSITDAARNRGDDRCLGQGYAARVAAHLRELHPDAGHRFLNRGCSGHRARDLVGRWSEDCLDWQPAVVSLLIGINDTWRRYDRQDPTPVESFATQVDHLLDQARRRTAAHLMVVEPFLLPVRDGQDAWREDLDPKRTALRELAAHHGATWVPLQSVLEQAAAHGHPADWLHDGVHPTPFGHHLIAAEILRRVAKAPAEVCAIKPSRSTIVHTGNLVDRPVMR